MVTSLPPPWAHMTSLPRRCNTPDWPPLQRIVGDGTLVCNHISLTWHVVTLPATVVPLSTAGHKLLSNRLQEMWRGCDTEKRLTETTETTTTAEQRGRQIHRYLCLTLSPNVPADPPLSAPPHLCPCSPLSVVTAPPPSLNTCRRTKARWSRQITDGRPAFSRTPTRRPVFSTIFRVCCVSCCDCAALGVNLINLSGNTSLVWWFQIRWGVEWSAQTGALDLDWPQINLLFVIVLIKQLPVNYSYIQ